MSQMSEDDLVIKHKKERKDLQSHVQNLKKTCTKGDKKKKKEITEQIARLELELEEKQNKELEELSILGDKKDEIMEDNVEEMQVEENTLVSLSEPKISKAQKRRNKKAVEERKREERILVQEKQNKNGPRMKETDKINSILKTLGLKIYNIPADGNCLYFAVSHQLEQTGRQSFTVPDLRKMTADYMRQHKDDFLPFMTHADEDKIFTEDQYEEYCNTLAKKPVWGGQIEIRALSNVLNCPIQVVQAESLTTIQGEQLDGPSLVLSYHRHLYRLGEHYNSTIATKEDEEEQ